MFERFDELYVVLKISEVCNLACEYCYFYFNGDDRYKENPKFISEATLEALVSFLKGGLSDLNISRITISLHGGEPLMVGKARFDGICSILRNGLRGVPELQMDIQTNATLIDDGWIEIFEKHSVGVGVSLDGPPEINDRYRLDHKGRGSAEAAIRGLRLLRASAEAGRTPDPVIGCVVTQSSDPDILFRYFFDDLGISAVRFQPESQDYENVDPQYQRHLERFYDRLFQLWTERNDARLRIVPFSQMLGKLITGNIEDVSSPLKNFTFTVRSDGGLSPEDALTPKDFRYRGAGYTVFNSTLKNFLTADFWPDVVAAYSQPQFDCQECQWAGLCDGGYAENRYKAGDGFSRKTVFCAANARMCENLFEYAASGFQRSVLTSRIRQLRRVHPGIVNS